MTYQYPIENLMQYTDKNGINYVSVYPKDLDIEPWFNSMIESYGLENLTKMFPYVVLHLDTETGLVMPNTPASYNAKVTNAFHILLAQQRDAMPQPQQLPEVDPRWHSLNYNSLFEEKIVEETRDIGVGDPEKYIMSSSDGYGIDNDKLPENAVIKQVPKGWHPNKDANGNFISSSIGSNFIMLNNGSMYPYGMPYYGYGYSYPNTQYTATPSYLPQYIPSNNNYPF